MTFLHDRVAQDWEDAIPMQVICHHYELQPAEVFYLLARAGKPTNSYWKGYDQAAIIYDMFTATAVRCVELERQLGHPPRSVENRKGPGAEATGPLPESE